MKGSMDSPAPHRRIPTRNQTGWTSNQLNEVSRLFAAFCGQTRRPVLDIGAAYGIASLAALDAGATVIANDLEPQHLEVLRQSAGPERERRLILIPARFPRHLRFTAGSLDAVHASNVLHFLTPPQMEQGFAAIYHWLAPGGRLFVQASTPFQQPFQEFVPEFLARKRSGQPAPGWIENTRDYSAHRRLDQIPASLHLLDDATLRRFAEAAGLHVIDAWLYRRSDLPASLNLDGRECAGLIAERPSDPSATPVA